ncbi:MAG TPA: sigma 54-interacting transcriptional regulator [Thermoanaerobaculia bacterium]|nr:sigma 54-interacting transcriptional regulator [Thermoanaerobaculia bacterium]
MSGAVRALVWRAGAEGLVRSELPPISAAALSGLREGGLPAVCVVAEGDLQRFCELPEEVVDCGRKPRGRGLAALLLGHDRVPLLRGYRHPGQLVRGTRALLAHALGRDDRNLYLLGVPEALLARLWERSSWGGRATAASAPASAPESAWAALSQLLEVEEVPAALARRYLGDAPEARVVRQLVLRAARTDHPVLVLGETGTGKEVVARAIHDLGPRKTEPFTPVNCGAIPPDLLESELFGHEPESFTGARRRKEGLWRAAGHGTLFLDEIGELPPMQQVKILRALEAGTVRPVGGEAEVPVRARVVAATNRDVLAMVRAGRFREDLYYRLRLFLIPTPPLRDHAADVPLLAQAFWHELTGGEGKPLPRPLLAELAGYRWPGNARELKAILANLYVLFGARGFGVPHLRAVLRVPGGEAPAARTDAEAEIRLHRAECLRHLRRVEEALRACDVTLRSAFAAAPDDSAAAAATRAAVAQRAEELRLLMLHPLLFHGEEPFASLDHVEEGLRELLPLLDQDLVAARRGWQRLQAGPLEEARLAVVREAERLLARL